MNTSAKQSGLILAAALALGMGANAANAQVAQGYVGSSGDVVKNATGLCWRTGYWTPAMATEQCDPDLVPKKPAPPVMAPPVVTPPAVTPPPAPKAAPPAPPAAPKPVV